MSGPIAKTPNFPSAHSAVGPYKEPGLTEKEWEFFRELENLLSDPILDKPACYALGQKIFDHYKAAGNCWAGSNALFNVYFMLGDKEGGLTRQQRVREAWSGVGDTTWWWGKY